MKSYLRYLPFFVTITLAVVSLYLTSQFEYETSYSRKSAFLELIELSDHSISVSEILTIVLLVVVLILILLKNKYWAHLFATVTLLSSIHILQVFLYTYSFGFLALKLEGISFILLAIHLSLNPNVLDDLKFLTVSQQTVNPKIVESFEHKYQSFTYEELEYIATSEKHTKEAKAAAKNLLAKLSEH